jgi:hypothetical protein
VARRTWLLGSASAVLTAAVVGALFFSTRPQIIEAGQTVVFVEGRDLMSFGQARAGMGITGTLGLVGERCVALVSDTGTARIIVWPPGTKRARLGSGDQHHVAYFEERLPSSCRNIPLIDVGLAS